MQLKAVVVGDREDPEFRLSETLNVADVDTEFAMSQMDPPRKALWGSVL